MDIKHHLLPIALNWKSARRNEDNFYLTSISACDSVMVSACAVKRVSRVAFAFLHKRMKAIPRDLRHLCRCSDLRNIEH